MDQFEPIIRNIAQENGFKDYEITAETGSNKGYVGILNRYRITEDGRELSLFCKFLPDDDERNTRLNSYKLFKREVLIFKELFPIFQKFQEEHNIPVNDKEGFWSNPKGYYCHYDEEDPKKSVIVMEDLTINNFEGKDEFTPSDFDHTSKLFEELAKFHALSLAIKQKKPELLEKFKHEKNIICEIMQSKSMKHIAPRNLMLVAKLFQQEDEIREKLLSYKDDLWLKVAANLDEAALLPHSIICHGDVWINNVLYNYTDDKKTIIKDMKLVDWQNVHLGSIGAELAYYLYCCVDLKFRKSRHEELIQLYYNSMRQFLNKFEIDVEKVLPYETLKKEISAYGLYSFGMVNFAAPLLCKYPEKLFENENATDLTDEERKHVELYEKTIRQAVLEMIDLNIIL